MGKLEGKLGGKLEGVFWLTELHPRLSIQSANICLLVCSQMSSHLRLLLKSKFYGSVRGILIQLSLKRSSELTRIELIHVSFSKKYLGCEPGGKFRGMF